MRRHFLRLMAPCSALGAVLFLWSAPALAETTTTTIPVGETSTTVVATATATVSATPNTGLSDLETITVAGSGFLADHLLNVAQCNLFNNKAGGVCYGPTRTSPKSDGSGAFSTSFIVRRVIVESGSSADCGSAPAKCGIIVGDVNNTAVATLTFDPSRPANRPQVTAAPNTGLHSGDTVQIAGSGFTPNEKVVIAQCASTTLGLAHCDINNEATAIADEKGSFPTVGLVVHASITIPGSDGGPLDCLPTAGNEVPCVIVAANFIGASEFATATVAFEAPTVLPRSGTTSLPLAIVAVTSLAAGAALVFTTRRRRGNRVRASRRSC